MISQKKLDEAYKLAESLTIDKCRESFWFFCRTLAPDFYIKGRTHLEILCKTLQKFYENTLLDENGTPYKKMIIQMPPRHGKSRTLFMFAAWILGKNNKNRIVTASYNDELAQNFSKYTRDVIACEKSDPLQFIFSDIFDARIKRGDASYKQWALDGQFFNYRGSGIGGTLTGLGSNWLIVDDPVKDAATAYNENALDKIWQWYTGTFISRGEHAKQIICQTPWSSQDVGGRLLAKEPELWYQLSLPACTDGVMLCDDILSKEEYDYLKSTGDEHIIAANYDLVRVDIKGALYGESLMTYDRLPDVKERFCGYTDTADEGEDYLSSFVGVVSGTDFYVTDCLYTQEPQEITEVQQADMIINNKIKEIQIESNNGGRAFARNVDRILRERGYTCAVEWFHQSDNKIARINSNSSIVKTHVFFPENWNKRWPELYLALVGYQRAGKNKHDDAPDALTGVCEKYLAYNVKFSDDIINQIRAARSARR